MIIKVKVITKASVNTVTKDDSGVYMYKIKTTLVAEKGKANKKVLELLADYLQISSSQIRIVSGHKSNIKTIAINE